VVVGKGDVIANRITYTSKVAIEGRKPFFHPFFPLTQ